MYYNKIRTNKKRSISIVRDRLFSSIFEEDRVTWITHKGVRYKAAYDSASKDKNSVEYVKDDDTSIKVPVLKTTLYGNEEPENKKKQKEPKEDPREFGEPFESPVGSLDRLPKGSYFTHTSRGKSNIPTKSELSSSTLGDIWNKITGKPDPYDPNPKAGWSILPSLDELNHSSLGDIWRSVSGTVPADDQEGFWSKLISGFTSGSKSPRYARSAITPGKSDYLRYISKEKEQHSKRF